MTAAALVIASALLITFAALSIAAWWDDRQERLWDAREECPDCRAGGAHREPPSRLDDWDGLRP